MQTSPLPDPSRRALGAARAALFCYAKFLDLTLLAVRVALVAIPVGLVAGLVLPHAQWLATNPVLRIYLAQEQFFDDHWIGLFLFASIGNARLLGLTAFAYLAGAAMQFGNGHGGPGLLSLIIGSALVFVAAAVTKVFCATVVPATSAALEGLDGLLG